MLNYALNSCKKNKLINAYEAKMISREATPVVQNKRKSNVLIPENVSKGSDTWGSSNVSHNNKIAKFGLYSTASKINQQFSESDKQSELKTDDILAEFFVNNKKPDQPLNWFESKESFSQTCDEINAGYSFLPQFILNHTVMNYANNAYTSWITWPQIKYSDKNMYLKLEFTTFKFKLEPLNCDYHSWIFSEADFLKLHSYTYSAGSQSYFHFKVYEEIYSAASEYLPDSSKQILDVWSSSDSSFGELRDLKKGQVLSGTEVMSVFHFLNENLLKIKTTYLCDASRVNGDDGERAPGQIVFRVLMSVAYGSTWYEKFGYQAFQFNNLLPGYPGEVGSLSQDTDGYYHARNELMKLPVDKLYQTLFELELKLKNKKYRVLASNTLSDLSKAYCKHDPSSVKHNTQVTLSVLASAVYDEFKKSGDMSDLAKMHEVLSVPDKYLAEGVNKPEYYKHLCTIVGTRFFRKQNPISGEVAGSSRELYLNPRLGKGR